MVPARADVIVVGASLAGATTALLLGRQGLQVLLLERQVDPQAWKPVCTHFIQPSATPVLRAHGLAQLLEEAGAVRSVLDVWTRWGWIRWDLDDHGYNLRRETMDPVLRHLAASTPGVTLVNDAEVTDLIRQGDQIVGVTGQQGETPFACHARLVIAADGRHGKLPPLAGVPTRVHPHNRFSYLAYFRGIDRGDTRQRTWFLDPDVAYESPTDDGLTCLSVQVHKDRLDEWRADPEATLRRLFADLQDGPDLARATRVGRVLGMLEMPNHTRPAAYTGMALVGDAAMAADPLFGIGCGWAFQSAAWLAGTVGPALQQGADLRPALLAYRRQHARSLGPHYRLTCALSTGRRLNAGERLIYRGAARDPIVARAVHLVTARSLPPRALFAPSILARSVAASFARGN